MDSGVESGKGETGYLTSFHSILLFVLSTEDDQQVAFVAVPDRREGGGEKGERENLYPLSQSTSFFPFLSSPFRCTTLDILYKTVKFLKQNLLKGAKFEVFKAQATRPTHNLALLTVHLQQTKVRTKLKERQLKHHKRRNLASGT